MASPACVDLQELAEQEHAPAEQIVASALELYAALPAARRATRQALRTTAPTADALLAPEVSRAVIGVQLQQRRAAALRRIDQRTVYTTGGAAPDAPGRAAPEALSRAEEEALGAEVLSSLSRKF